MSRKILGGALDTLLKDLVRQHRTELYDPFAELLQASPRLQDELDAIVDSLQVFFNKWTVEILVVLSQGRPVRFNEMRDQLAGISGRTLSQRLKELEDQGFVLRSVHDERPVRIDYALTEKGRDVAALALPLVLYLRAATR